MAHRTGSFALLFVALGVAAACAPDADLGEGTDELTTMTPIPATEQRAGDPARGYDALVNEGYVSLGIPWSAYKAHATPLEARDVLPGRRGKNQEVPYIFTVSTKECLGEGPRESIFYGLMPLSAAEHHCAPGQPEPGEIVGTNCLACHASRINGQLVVGLGRPSHEPARTSGWISLDPMTIMSVWASLSGSAQIEYQRYGVRLLRGNTLDTSALQASYRDPKTLVWTSDNRSKWDAHSGLEGWVDVPPWWRMKKKNALYYNGMGRGDQVRHMMNMTIFSVKDVAEAEKIDGYFNDVAAFIRSIEPPKFPGAIDTKLAANGEQVFGQTCAGCHGTYGANPTYPNLLIQWDAVGTDPMLAAQPWMNRNATDWFADSWYGNTGARIKPLPGYMAPPLDGIWATAPFFHNGSVPTLEGVLDSSKRPERWQMNYGDDDYDLERVGWRYWNGSGDTYDTTRDGAWRTGHKFGDALSAEDRRAVLEYLKTL